MGAVEKMVTRTDRDGRTRRITLVVTGALAPAIDTISDAVLNAAALAEARLGMSLDDDLSFFFDSRPDDHNGLATVIPTNRVYVQTEAPFIEDTIGLSRDYLVETILHELGHMTSIQKRSGVFRPLSWLVGTASRPVGVWPRWIHEGSAIWTEAALGGRPASGAIDFDVRRYAEYARRTGREPFTNAELDGAYLDSRVEEGVLPYHFGYRLIDAWIREAGAGGREAPFREFVNESSRSLGLAFRSSFRSIGPSIDETFANERKRWRETSIPIERPGRKIAEAVTMRGPFTGPGGIGWVELSGRGERRKRVAGRTLEGRMLETKWTSRFEDALEAHPLNDGAWAMLIRRNSVSSAQPIERYVAVLETSGRRRCRFRTPPRLREIAVSDTALAWTRSQEDGTHYLEYATADWTTCALGPVKLEAESRARFERISAPAWGPTGGLAYSLSDERDSFSEHLILGKTEAFDVGRPLTNPYPLAKGWLASLYTSSYRGPVLFEGGSVKQLPLATGALRSVPFGNQIAVKVSLWDKDELRLYDLADFERAGWGATPPEAPTLTTPASGAATATQAYSPLKSLWPEFWIPTIAAGTGGFSAFGQTFYEDLTGDWAGSTSAGYDSFTRKGFATTQLTRRRIEGRHLAEGTLRLSYVPFYNYYALPSENVSLDRYEARLSLRLLKQLPVDAAMSLEPSVDFTRQTGSKNVPASRVAIPAVAWTLNTADSRPIESPLRIRDIKGWGVWAQQRIGFAQQPFFETDVHATGLLSTDRFETEAALQFGSTGQKNFPSHYYDWGGLPELSTRPRTGYLARGFATRLPPARMIARGALTSRLEAWRPHWALSWNRARLDAVELALVAETASYRPFFDGPPDHTQYRLSGPFFTSLGGRVDLWGRLAHYIQFNGSLGVFRGLGEFGETRIVMTLSSLIDI